MDILKLEKSNDAEKCKGIYVRHRFSSYVGSNNTLEFRHSFRILKRKSCKGCDHCQQFWEDLRMTGKLDETLRLPTQLIDGAIYELIFVAGPLDWETSICDDWWWELKYIGR